MPRTEGLLDKRIAERAKQRRAYHVKLHGSAFQPGLPDHLLCYKGRFVYLEAKAESAVSPLQRRHIMRARAQGGIAEVIYDTRLLDDILDCLDRGDEWTVRTLL